MIQLLRVHTSNGLEMLCVLCNTPTSQMTVKKGFMVVSRSPDLSGIVPGTILSIAFIVDFEGIYEDRLAKADNSYQSFCVVHLALHSRIVSKEKGTRGSYKISKSGRSDYYLILYQIFIYIHHNDSICPLYAICIQCILIRILETNRDVSRKS
jgi:hypothetical protein